MPRKLPPHIVLPNGQWRFVKRGSRGVGTKKRKVVHMARRRRSYGRRYSAPRRRGGGGRMRLGGMKGLITPIAAGAADAIINPRLPVNGIGSTAIGILMKDQVVKELGLYQVGQSLATFIPYVGAQAGGVTSQV